MLLYSKTQNYVLNPAYKPLSEASQKLFKFDDKDGRGRYQTVSLQKPRDPGPETTYDYIDNSGKVWACPPKGWRMKYEKIKALENDNRLVLTGNTLRVKDYWNERENEGKRVDTLWNDLPQNTAGSGELEAIMGRANTFDNPKPTDLIKRCLEIGGKQAIVLDFFAGSGTTGHAVMKLNAEDGGNRRFILCTNNENNICREVTYERIKRVIDKEGYAASLKYFKVDYIPVSERMYYEYADELLAHIRELGFFGKFIILFFLNFTEIVFCHLYTPMIHKHLMLKLLSLFSLPYSFFSCLSSASFTKKLPPIAAILSKAKNSSILLRSTPPVGIN